MLTHGKAIAFTYWQRYGMRFAGILGAIILLAIVAVIGRYREDKEMMGLSIPLSFSVIFLSMCYLVSVFVFGFTSNVNQNGSCYPKHFLILPVSTATLALIPAFLLVVSLSLLWIIFTLLLPPIPLTHQIPLLWPSLLLADLSIAALIIFWWPLRFWARLVAWILFGHFVIVGVGGSHLFYLVGVPWEMPATVYLLACLVVETVLLYEAVWRARCNRITEWQIPLISFLTRYFSFPTQPPAFKSPFAAQLWYENKRNWLAFPLFVGWVAAFCLRMLFISSAHPPIHFEVVLMTLAIPLFLGGSGVNVTSENNRGSRDHFGLGSYIATRPLISSALLKAKLISTFRLVLITWGIVLVEMGLALYWSNTYREVWNEIAKRLSEESTAAQLATIVTILLLLILFTWNQSVEVMLFGLLGRGLLVNAVVMGKFMALFLAVFGLLMSSDLPDEFYIGLRAIEMLMLGVVPLKLLLGLVFLIRIHRKKLLSARTLWVAVGLWFSIVVTVSSVLLWGLPVNFFPPVLIVTVVILMTPFASLAATPLAIEWSRHR